VIDAPAATQVARLVLRDGIHPALARQMLAAQASREQRLARADDVIRNETSVDALRAAVAELHALYVEIGKTGQKPATGRHLP
jgi:dephospho-CoA kinase